MTDTVQSPFEGFPLTEKSQDEAGNPGFLVTPGTLTPFRARAAEQLSGLAGIALVGDVFYDAVALPNQTLTGDALYLGAAIAGALYLRRFLLRALRVKTRILLTATRFSVQNGLKWKHYDRLLPHKFALLPHDKARAEREMQDLADRRAQLQRKVISHARYYGESYHVSYDYLGQRNDVVTVYGQKEALAVVTRLKACDEALDALARNGQGTALDPADEWGDQPGKIPETASN